MCERVCAHDGENMVGWGVGVRRVREGFFGMSGALNRKNPFFSKERKCSLEKLSSLERKKGMLL